MGFGHGKIILLGEHAVVYGKPALVASIGRGVHAAAKIALENVLRIQPWNVSVNADADSSEALSRAFAVILKASQVSQNLNISVDVELPAASGLGCSAALGVAIARAIAEATQTMRSDEEIIRFANEWEQTFHDNPSGVDVSAACLGTVLYFKKGAVPSAVPVKQSAFFVVGHSGETSNTRDMVMGLARQRDRDRKHVDQQIDAIGELVETATNTLKAGNLLEFGQFMDMNHSLLSSMMLCTTALDEMCVRARSAGALGAKLTGAGGGGCMIALAKDENSAQLIQENLTQLGKEVFVTKVPH